MNTAIIVAAGSGQRFAGDQPKQFVELLGKPLILHTLGKFEAASVIDEIILVLSQAGRDEFEAIGAQFEISKLKSIVIGGLTRAESVRNGLSGINAATANLVAIHDGARPLVSTEEITRTVEKAAETGAACLVASVTDTIKQIDGKHISGTLDRTSLRRALTPQVFRFELLIKAFDGIELSESITDECSLVERLGHPIVFVEGSPRNIKITHSTDLLVAAALLGMERSIEDKVGITDS